MVDGHRSTTSVAYHVVLSAAVILQLLLTRPTVADVIPHSTTSATVGNTAKLKCKIGDASATAMWFSPTNELLTTDFTTHTLDRRFRVPSEYQSERNLYIDGVQTSDVGTYLCKRADTQAVLAEVILQVNVPPTLTQGGNVTVDTGADATLTCRLTAGTPTPTVTWSFRGNRYESPLPQTGETLTLSRASRDQAGEYSCHADNGIPPAAKKTIRLDVRFAPTLLSPYFRELRQPIGTNVVLTCVVDANPVGEINWRRDRDGQTAVADDRVRQLGSTESEDDGPPALTAAATSDFRFQTWPISRDGYTRLVEAFIDDITADDYGTYTCFATNKYGSADAKMSITGFGNNDTSFPSAPPVGASSCQEQQASLSSIVVLSAMLVLAVVVAVVLGACFIKQRRDAKSGASFEANRPQIYKNCRS